MGIGVQPCCCGGSPCDTGVFADNFSSVDPGWYLDLGWTISGGTMNTPGSGFTSRCRTLPSPNGLVFTVQCDIYFDGSAGFGNSGTAAVGIIADGTQFKLFARPGPSNYGLSAPGSPGALGVGPVPANGDTLKLVVTDISGGAGHYRVDYYVNGTNFYTLPSITWTYGNPINYGVGATIFGGIPWQKFDNFYGSA